jgi:outer membrane protein OmpA-like peptidoglycan-associated protein
MAARRTLPVLVSIIALTLCSCATKKYVQQQVGASKTELSTRIDEEASRRENLGNQLQELSVLNKQNTEAIGRVDSKLDGAVKTLDPKIEDARRTGSEARETANTALNSSKENAAAFVNRNNYQSIESHDVTFKFNSAALDDQARVELDRVAEMVANDKNFLLEVQGYADSSGDSNYNVQISNRRVESVVRYLVGSRKVELHRISSLGLGDADPIDDNNTREGRARNRRVTVRVLGVKAP